MSVDQSRIGRVLGDRLLVRRVKPPEKQRGLWVIRNSPLGEVKEQVLWWGVVEGLGLDARYPEAYAIEVGDIVGVVDVGGHSAGFDGTNGESYVWVPEEFVAAVDDGRQAHLARDQKWTRVTAGLRPVGAFVLIAPDSVEEKRGGVMLPHSAKTDTRTGKVLSVSVGALRGDELFPLHVATGVDVLFGKYAGCWARFPDAEFLLAKEDDLIAELLPAKVKETAGA